MCCLRKCSPSYCRYRGSRTYSCCCYKCIHRRCNHQHWSEDVDGSYPDIFPYRVFCCNSQGFHCRRYMEYFSPNKCLHTSTNLHHMGSLPGSSSGGHLLRSGYSRSYQDILLHKVLVIHIQALYFRKYRWTPLACKCPHTGTIPYCRDSFPGSSIDVPKHWSGEGVYQHKLHYRYQLCQHRVRWSTLDFLHPHHCQAHHRSNYIQLVYSSIGDCASLM